MGHYINVVHIPPNETDLKQCQLFKVVVGPSEHFFCEERFDVFPVQIVKNRVFVSSPCRFFSLFASFLPSRHPTAQVAVTVTVAGKAHANTQV